MCVMCYILRDYDDIPAFFTGTWIKCSKMELGTFGFINNIINLHANAKITEVEDHFIRRIYELLRKPHNEGNSCIPEDKEKLEKEILEIERRLDQILTNREWSWDTILAATKNTCDSSERAAISDIEVHPNKIAQNLQVSSRIKN